MRRLICFLLICMILLCAAVPVCADNRELIVYIASGSSSAYRYHARSSCSSLSRSTVAAVTLEDAASRGFTPCTKCRPPSPDFDVTSTPRPKSGSSSGYKPAVTPFVRSQSSAEEAPAVSVQTSKHSSDYYLLLLPAAFLVAVLVRQHQLRVKQEEAEQEAKRERQAQERAAELARRKKEEVERRQSVWEAERAIYLRQFRGKSSLQLAGAPPDASVGDDGLPVSGGPGRWGERYTFYLNRSGRKFHAAGCRLLKSDASPVNASTLAAMHKIGSDLQYTPCSVCCPSLPDTSWVQEYKHIEKIKEKYLIPTIEQ